MERERERGGEIDFGALRLRGFDPRSWPVPLSEEALREAAEKEKPVNQLSEAAVEATKERVADAAEKEKERRNPGAAAAAEAEEEERREREATAAATAATAPSALSPPAKRICV